MRKIYTFFILLVLLGFGSQSFGQCTFLTNALPGPDSLITASGTANRSGVAWNPTDSLYYSVNAGSSSYPIETFLSGGGTSVASPSSGISFRGLWWNSSTGQLEGNGYNTTGLRKQDLDANGYALGTGVSIYSGLNQPNVQSCGHFDYQANEVIYYDNGSIYRYSRATGAALGSYALNNIPSSTADILDFGVIYTGCTGNEIGIYDYTNQRIYLFDKATGNWATTIQLPATAPQNPSFGLSFANDYVWIFDGVARIWYSYQIYQICSPPTANITAQSTSTFCEGDSVVIMADTGSGLTYQWQVDGTDIPGATSDVLVADSSGSYRVIVSNSPGCADTSTAIMVIENAYPPATITPAGMTSFCEGGMVDLVADSGYAYQWYLDGNQIPSANNQLYVADSAGSYTVMVTDTTGCASTSNAEMVTEWPLPMPAISQSGDTLFAQSGYSSYDWDLNGNPFQMTSVNYIVPDTSGDFAVTVVDSNGCSNTSGLFSYTYVGTAAPLAGTLRLFPNPTPGDAILNYTGSKTGSGTLRITNPIGQIILEVPVEKQNHTWEHKLSLNNLSAGIYGVELQIENQRSFLRLIKK